MPTPDEQPLTARLDTADAPILAAVLRELAATDIEAREGAFTTTTEENR
jgi:hypothetical protein